MFNRDKAVFCFMAALIFAFFSPVHLLSGQIVAAVGFVSFGIAAVLYWFKKDNDQRK